MYSIIIEVSKNEVFKAEIFEDHRKKSCDFHMNTIKVSLILI